ncbi:MAG: hypothetical protein ABI180_14355 [Microcoleus sp.]
MSAKFLGWGLNPKPKNNPPKGGGLNPLCFGKAKIGKRQSGNGITVSLLLQPAHHPGFVCIGAVSTAV